MEPPKFTEQEVIDVLKKSKNMKLSDLVNHFRNIIGKSSHQQQYFKDYATKLIKTDADGIITLKE